MKKNDDIFGSIDISELAGLEEPAVVDPKDTGMTQGDGTATIDKNSTPNGDTKETGLEEDPNAIDLNLLIEDDTSSEEGDEKDSLKTPDNVEGKQSSSSQTDATTSLATALYEEGVFSSTAFTEEEIKEIKSGSDMVEAMRKQIAENEYATLTETQKQYLENLKEGVPERTFHERTKSADAYKKITNETIEGNVGLATELIKRGYLIKGVDETTATEMAAINARKGDSVAIAIASRDALIAFDESALEAEINSKKAEREAREKKEREALTTLKATIQSSDEILPGIKGNSTTKNKIFDSMTTSIKEAEDGSPLNEVMAKYQEDPEFRYKLHAAYLTTKGFTDFKKFTNKAKSDAVKDLDAKMKTGLGTKTGSHSPGGLGGLTAKDIAASMPDF